MFALVFLAVVLLALTALYVHDRRQTAHTILRNYPVIGYFRYFAETLGEYMRQYQYLPDWAERPFNGLERGWVYRSAKGVSNLRSLGSENVPAFVFRNAAFPVLDEEKRPYPGKQIGLRHGPSACRQPYHAKTFFNISGMSYCALSPAAVSALSRGGQDRRSVDGDRGGRPGTEPSGGRLRQPVHRPGTRCHRQTGRRQIRRRRHRVSGVVV
jgi:hypothetical protein